MLPFTPWARGSSVAPDPGGLALFTDDFATNDLTHFENNIGWGTGVPSGTGGGSNNTTVSGGKLRFNYPPSGVESEQRFTTGTQKYLEWWMGFDFTAPSNYTQGAGNNKAYVTAWSNTSGSASDDGYAETATNEMLIGLEFNQNDTPDGGSALALRVQAGESGVLTLDYNASNPTLWPNAVAVADRNTTKRIVIHCKASTFRAEDPETGQGPFWWPSDGIIQVWKDGTLIMNKTDANLYKEGWQGMNRFYLFGYRNGPSTEAETLIVDNFVFSDVNTEGVTT